MANSGIKIIKTLRKYINGVPTEEIKNNVISDSDYIANFASSDDCPTGCNAIVSGDYLINNDSSGNSNHDTTTTTSSTTTTTTQAVLERVKRYLIENLSSDESLVVITTDEFGDTQTNTITENDELLVYSTTEPYRSSGSTNFSIKTDGAYYTPVNPSTTTTLRQSTDYTIDNSDSSETSIVSLTQMGGSETVETEIKAGSSVTVTSDTAPTVESGEATVSSGTSVTPEAEDYTVTNNDYFDTVTVQYRPWLSTTDEIILSPRETRTINSQEEPTVSSSSDSEDITVTASGNPTQPADPTPIPRRICNQYATYNDSNYTGSFRYVDCEGRSRILTLQPRQSASIPSQSVPVAESGGMGSNYHISLIEKGFGNSGSANEVVSTTSSTTSTTSTSTTEPPNTQDPVVQEVVKDGKCGKHYYFKEVTQRTDTAPRWFPETFKISVENITGSFDFISFDPGFVPVLYKVYDGTNLLLDKCIVSDENGNKWRSRAETAFRDAGMSSSDAKAYTFGNKTKSPDKIQKRRGRGAFNPFDRKEKTTFTLNKVSRNDYITIQVYAPLHNGLDYASGISHGAKFEIGCIK